MSLPPGPKTPAIWQMIYWIVRPFAFMRQAAQAYGDSFTARLGSKFAPIVFLSHPQALQTLLTSDDAKTFESPGEINALFEPLLGTQSVIGLSGDRHRRMRQLLMPPFHGERMRSYEQIIGNITTDIIRSWPMGQTVSVHAAMQAISMRVILSAVFGLVEGPRYQRLEKLLGKLLNDMSNPMSVSLLYFPALRQDFGPWSPWGSFVRQRQQVDQIIYAEIAERRSQPDATRPDILTMLLSVRDEAGEPMTDVELRDELMTLLVAGHETTATALTWALYWIHKLPAVRDRLVQELQTLGDRPDANALFRLPYLNAVCSETLRIYPVGMLTFARVVRSPVKIGEHQLEPGTLVTGCIYLTHHREEIYPEADRFNPDRFLVRQFSPFEYLPFGGGSRRCIGMAFAQFEMKVVLSQILSQVDLVLADPQVAYPVRRGLTAGASPVRLRVQKLASSY